MAELRTKSGHKLTFREAKFIEFIVAGKTEDEAYLMAGYTGTVANKKALINKGYIQAEIDERFKELRNSTIADASEVMQYYTDVMRGQLKDQFGLEAPLAERTKAANELAKRLIDYQHEAEMKTDAQDINITLNWGREDTTDDKIGQCEESDS